MVECRIPYPVRVRSGDGTDTGWIRTQSVPEKLGTSASYGDESASKWARTKRTHMTFMKFQSKKTLKNLRSDLNDILTEKKKFEPRII